MHYRNEQSSSSSSLLLAILHMTVGQPAATPQISPSLAVNLGTDPNLTIFSVTSSYRVVLGSRCLIHSTVIIVEHLLQSTFTFNTSNANGSNSSISLRYVPRNGDPWIKVVQLRRAESNLLVFILHHHHHHYHHQRSNRNSFWYCSGPEQRRFGPVSEHFLFRSRNMLTIFSVLSETVATVPLSAPPHITARCQLVSV